LFFDKKLQKAKINFEILSDDSLILLKLLVDVEVEKRGLQV